MFIKKELFSFNCMLMFSAGIFFLFFFNSNVFATMSDFGIIDFLKDVQQERKFENILIMQNQNATIAKEFVWENGIENVEENQTLDWSAMFVERIMFELQMPILSLNELKTFNLKRYFSVEMLSIVLIDGPLNDHIGLFKNLVQNLRHMTISNILFLLNFEDSEKKEILIELFQYCWSNKMINVAAIFKDYQKTGIYYSYTNFPNFELEVKQLPTSNAIVQEIYPYRLGDLKGYRLPYIIGGSDPRIIVYLDKNGKMVVAGFAGHFLQAFAKKFNCELFEPLPTKLNSFAPAQELIAAVRNGTVEISAGLTFPSIPISGYTYPYEQMSWCVMLPVESDIPGYEFYIIVFELTAFLLTLALIILISIVLSIALYRHGYSFDIFDLILHDDCLRGVLGQPFSIVTDAPTVLRFIYLQICVLGILLTTSYNAYFATYVTSAPKEPPIEDFDAILNSGLKIYAWTPEFNELVGRVAAFKRYIPMFYLENNYQAYLKMRDSFNTKFGYMMPSTKWKIIDEQQKIFTTPIFKRNEEFCFYHNIPMVFPVHENSIFMETLYQLMLETAQAGLTDYWQKIGFLELIVAGKLSFADLSTTRSFEAMKVEDLFYVWLSFAFMTILITLVFLGEWCVFKRKKIFGVVRRWFGI